MHKLIKNLLNEKNSINSCLFLIFLTLNVFQPLCADDINRSIIAAFYHHTVLQNLISDYKGWTGRMSAQFLVYLFFNQPYETIILPIFNGINTVLLVILYNLVYKVASQRKYSTGSFLFFIFIFTLFLYQTGFLRNALWKTGALQYFWGVVLIVWFLQKEYFRINQDNNHFLLSFAVGIFIGLYNEIFFASLLITYVFSLFYYRFIKNNYPGIISKDTFFFNSGNILADLVLVIAPGNYVRKHVVDASTPTMNICSSLLHLGHNVLNNSFLISIFVVILFFVLLKKTPKEEKKRRTLAILALFFFPIALLLVFLPISTFGFEERMLLLIYTFAILLFLHNFSFIFSKVIFSKKSTITALVILNSLLFSIILYGYYTLYVFNNNRIKQISEKSLAVYKFSEYVRPAGLTKLIYFDDITTDPKIDKNINLANYYGVKEVILVRNS